MLFTHVSKYATKADMAGLQARLDALEGKVDRVAVELVRTRAEMVTKTELAAFQQQVQFQLNHITNLLDRLTGEWQDNRRTLLVYDKILGEHGEKLESHDKRLSNLEGKA